MLKIGFYQFRPLFGRKNKNLSNIISALSHAEADIIIIPELPFTGYYFKDREELRNLAEEPGKSSIIESLINLCRERKFYLVTGFAEKYLDRCFNSSILLGAEGIIHIYRKLHLFNEEKNWFDPGDIPLQVNDVKDVKIGMMICFDWVFPEVTRSLALQGADIICHPSNLVLDYCQQTMLSRCLENGVFAVAVNRFGIEKRPHGELKFTGKSQIVGPKGNLIFRAQSQRNALYVTSIDVELAHDKRITPFNDVIKDRRPEFYKQLTK